MKIYIGKNRRKNNWFAWSLIDGERLCFNKRKRWTPDSVRHNRQSKRELISDIKQKYNLYKICDTCFFEEGYREMDSCYKAVHKK